MIEAIKYKKFIFGYIVRYKKKYGVNFFTPPNLGQQVGFIKHKKNHNIIPHLHLKNKRKIDYMSEVLIIQKGKIRIDLYSLKKKYLFSKILKKDDILILIKGAHGFEVLDNCEMIEIKQGPFDKKVDKIRFEKNKKEKLILK
ncbi:hypothetical protein OAR46_01760 [Candidatus Pelagibacter sp.]|nr:hypothetical protein [Candidatus Pelagibacter sp.]